MTENFKNNEEHAPAENKKDRAIDILKKELKRSWEWFKPSIYIAVLYFLAVLIYYSFKEFFN